MYELEKQETSNIQGADQRIQAKSSATHLFVQTALLYTSSEGERRIRTHNLALPFTGQRTDPFEHLDMNQLNSFVFQQSISRLDTVPNFVGTRSYVQLAFQNVCQAVLSLYRGTKPDTYDYIIGYCMGMMKNEIFFPQAAVQTNWYCDFLNFLRFQCRMLGAEELSAFLWPQLFLVSDETISSAEPPTLLNLQRESLESTGIYVLFNTFNVYLWIGKEADPFFLQ